MRTFVCWVVCGVGMFSAAYGQPSLQSPPVFDPPEGIPAIMSFFAPIVFFPKIIQDDFRLKEYIRSGEFAEFRQRYGDLFAIDAIFHRALSLSWNNTYEALLISFIATMDHSRFGVKAPIVGSLIWVPLTSEFSGEFQARIQALPRRLYPDSPTNVAGDRDKLQHFFGSALITYLFESRFSAERVGMFIEWGEDMFIVDGVLDERDFRANRQGQMFGLRLLQDAAVRPSMFIRYSLAHDYTDLPGGCAPYIRIDGMEDR